MTIKELNNSIGGLGRNSKMPGLCYGISPSRCITGSKLRKVDGSVCSKCYARKGCYGFPSVPLAHARRLAAMDDLNQWGYHFVELLRRKGKRLPAKKRYFRWHDSGDLQSVNHLLMIVHIARMCKDWKFWLSTKEEQMVREAAQAGNITHFPDNLTIRLSAAMLGQTRSKMGKETATSSVDTDIGYKCPTPSQGGNCGDCRACWDLDVRNVDYKLH